MLGPQQKLHYGRYITAGYPKHYICIYCRYTERYATLPLPWMWQELKPEAM